MLKKVFVYGTLRRDLYKNFGAFMQAGEPLEGLGKISGIMYDINGSFPGVVIPEEVAGSDHVIGQVLAFDDLSDDQWEAQIRLFDQYEGVPSLYIRDKVDVLMDDGTEVEAYIYLFNAGDLERREVVPSGNWANA